MMMIFDLVARVVVFLFFVFLFVLDLEGGGEGDVFFFGFNSECTYHFSKTNKFVDASFT